MRRWASDSLRDALTHIGHAETYMTGGYDRTYCSALAPTIGEYRARYAADSLRSAQHNLVWAEHYAGLRSRESAAAADPFRSGRG